MVTSSHEFSPNALGLNTTVLPLSFFVIHSFFTIYTYRGVRSAGLVGFVEYRYSSLDSRFTSVFPYFFFTSLYI